MEIKKLVTPKKHKRIFSFCQDKLLALYLAGFPLLTFMYWELQRASEFR